MLSEYVFCFLCKVPFTLAAKLVEEELREKKLFKSGNTLCTATASVHLPQYSIVYD